MTSPRVSALPNPANAVVSQAVTSPFSPDVFAEAVARALENTLPAIVSALHANPDSYAPPLATTSSGLVLPVASPQQAGSSGQVSSAGRLNVPPFVPIFTPVSAITSLSLTGLVNSVPLPLFSTGVPYSQANMGLSPLPPKAEKAFVVGPGHAPVPYKLVAKITAGHFVDLADFLSANLRAARRQAGCIVIPTACSGGTGHPHMDRSLDHIPVGGV